METADLAAHLVIRERRPDTALGMVGTAGSHYTERVQRSERDRHSWTELVGQVRSGPPLLLRPLDEAINTIEYFVHHEDVRRAQPDWAPRVLGDLDAALWSRLRRMGRILLRPSADGRRACRSRPRRGPPLPEQR